MTHSSVQALLYLLIMLNFSSTFYQLFGLKHHVVSLKSLTIYLPITIITVLERMHVILYLAKYKGVEYQSVEHYSRIWTINSQ